LTCIERVLKRRETLKNTQSDKQNIADYQKMPLQS